MQNGWTHHAFFCNNPRSPSPGKFLPPPSPANVFPLSSDIGGTPDTFYTLIARQPRLTSCIASLFFFFYFIYFFFILGLLPALPSAIPETARLARWERSKVFSCMTSTCFAPREEQRGMHTQRAASFEPVYPGGISALNTRGYHPQHFQPRLSLPPSQPPLPSRTWLRWASRGAQREQRAPAATAPFVPRANPTSESCHIFLPGEA